MESAQAVAIVIDTGPSVRQYEPEVFDKMVAVAREVALSRMLYHSAFSERLGVIAIGSDSTKHDEEGYDGVEEIVPVGKIYAGILNEIQKLQLSKDGPENDLVDALVVAVLSVIKEVTTTQKKKKRIVFITDGGTQIQDLNQLGVVVSKIMEQKIQIDIVCHKYVDIKGYASNALDEEEKNSDSAGVVSDGPGDGSLDQLTEYLLGEFCVKERNSRKECLPGKQLGILRVNQSIMRRLAVATGGKIMAIEEALDLLARPTAKQTQSRCKFKGTLDISSNFRIPVEVWTKTQKTEAMSAQKISWEATLKAWDSFNPETNTEIQPPPQQVKESIIKLLSDVTYISSTSEDVIEDPTEIIRAYKYGPEYLTVDDFVATSLEYIPNEKGLKVMGTVSLDTIPLHRLSGNVSIVVPMKQSPQAWDMFYPLAFNLASTKTCLIASFVQRDRSEVRNYSSPAAPALVHIWGHMQSSKTEDGGHAMCRLYLAELPTTEAMRNAEDLPPLNCDPGRPLIDAYAALVEKAMLPDTELKASSTVNPSIHYLNAALVARSMTGGRAGSLNCSAPGTTGNTLKSKMEELAPGILKRLREIRPIEKRSKQPKKSSGLQDIEGKENEDLSMYLFSDDEEEETINFDWLSSTYRDIRLRASFLTEDFERLASSSDKAEQNFGFSSVGKEVLHLISDSFKGDCFEEAESCIKAFRRQAIQQGRCAEFNKLISSIASAVSEGDIERHRRDNFRAFIRSHTPVLTLVVSSEMADPDGADAASSQEALAVCSKFESITS